MIKLHSEYIKNTPIATRMYNGSDGEHRCIYKRCTGMTRAIMKVMSGYYLPKRWTRAIPDEISTSARARTFGISAETFDYTRATAGKHVAQ